MTVQLEVGMTAIRRDGGRVGPIQACPCGCQLVDDGKHLWHKDGTAGSLIDDSIIAAGYPWAQLGAQVGDTVRRVWHGYCNKLDDYEFTATENWGDNVSPNGLYVIVKRAKVEEPEIEWGDWLGGVYAGNKDYQEQCIKGRRFYRLRKPPVVQENNHCITAFGSDYKIKLTKVGDKTTVEIVNQKEYK